MVIKNVEWQNFWLQGQKSKLQKKNFFLHFILISCIKHLAPYHTLIESLKRGLASGKKFLRLMAQLIDTYELGQQVFAKAKVNSESCSCNAWDVFSIFRPFPPKENGKLIE